MDEEELDDAPTRLQVHTDVFELIGKSYLRHVEHAADMKKQLSYVAKKDSPVSAMFLEAFASGPFPVLREGGAMKDLAGIASSEEYRTERNPLVCRHASVFAIVVKLSPVRRRCCARLP